LIDRILIFNLHPQSQCVSSINLKLGQKLKKSLFTIFSHRQQIGCSDAQSHFALLGSTILYAERHGIARESIILSEPIKSVLHRQHVHGFQR